MTNALHYIITTLKDKYTYELTYNVIDSYYCAIEKVIILMEEDFKKKLKNLELLICIIIPKKSLNYKIL